jgi:glycogen debranching enzyme
VTPENGDFAPETYWRGPTWVNTNWLYAEALGEPLIESTLEMVAETGFVEYYHPIEGRALGATDFAWSAALTLDLIERSG